MLSPNQPVTAARPQPAAAPGVRHSPLAVVAGIGSVVPEHVLTNRDLEGMVETSDQWIVERTGIRERRIVAPNQATSDLAAEAARRALADAGVAAGEVDLIIVSTALPDMLFPATACLVQKAIGARRAAAFDLSAACTGFIYALSMAEGAIATGRAGTVLVVGAETLSRMTDYTDRGTCILFGDGAGAMVIRRAAAAPGPVPAAAAAPAPRRGALPAVAAAPAATPVAAPAAASISPGILSIYLAADGEGSGILSLPAGGSRLPASAETVAGRLHYIKMNGQEVFRFAVEAMIKAVRASLETSPLTMADVDLFVPHQANARIIDAATRFLRVPPEKIFHTIERYGNMSTASIPVSLDEARREGRLKDGDNVVLVAFGAGMTYGAAVLRWGRQGG